MTTKAQMASRGKATVRLWKDGHGIERLPLVVTVNGQSVDAVMVRAADLAALEDVLFEVCEVLALGSPGGMHWDDPADRDRYFEMADKAWYLVQNVWRGCDALVEHDGAERPR